MAGSAGKDERERLDAGGLAASVATLLFSLPALGVCLTFACLLSHSAYLHSHRFSRGQMDAAWAGRFGRGQLEAAWVRASNCGCSVAALVVSLVSALASCGDHVSCWARVVTRSVLCLLLCLLSTAVLCLAVDSWHGRLLVPKYANTHNTYKSYVAYCVQGTK